MSWWICFLQRCSFWLLKALIGGLVWITCGLLWCFYQLFGLSFWLHPFTAEDPLLRHWQNSTFLQIWRRNKLIYILNGLRVSTFSANFHFWVNYSLNDVSNSAQIYQDLKICIQMSEISIWTLYNTDYFGRNIGDNVTYFKWSISGDLTEL